MGPTAPAAAPRESVHDLGPLALSTLEWGDPDGPLALLVHGYPDTAWTWRHLGPVLAAAGWHVVAPFTRGYGPSDLSPDGRYLVSDLGADLLALRRRLAPRRRAVLVGHDWGALTAWHLSAVAGRGFDRYVMLAVPPGAALVAAARGPGGLGLALRQSRLSWYFLYNQLPVEHRLDGLIPRLWAAWSPGYDADGDVSRVLSALDTSDRRRAALGYYRDNLRRGLAATLSIRPGAPALYLHGTDDGCVDLRVAAASRTMLVSPSLFTPVPAAGHFLHLEQPERVAALIGEWIGPAG